MTTLFLLAILIGRTAEIDGKEIRWTCIYQTQEGEVRRIQHTPCEPALRLPAA